MLIYKDRTQASLDDPSLIKTPGMIENFRGGMCKKCLDLFPPEVC
jgi:hypothetical protein